MQFSDPPESYQQSVCLCLVQWDGTPFWHKPLLNFAAVLVRLMPPQRPTTVQTCYQSLRSACPECVTVLIFASAPPQEPHCKNEPPTLHGPSWRHNELSNPPYSLYSHSSSPINNSFERATINSGWKVRCDCICFYIDYKKKKSAN